MRQTNGLKGCRSDEVANNWEWPQKSPAVSSSRHSLPPALLLQPQLSGTPHGRSGFGIMTQMSRQDGCFTVLAMGSKGEINAEPPWDL